MLRSGSEQFLIWGLVLRSGGWQTINQLSLLDSLLASSDLVFWGLPVEVVCDLCSLPGIIGCPHLRFDLFSEHALEDYIWSVSSKVIDKATRILDNIWISSSTIRLVLEGGWLLEGLGTVVGRWSVLPGHHVGLVLVSESSIVEDDVAVTAWTISHVTRIAWVVSSGHSGLERGVRVLPLRSPCIMSAVTDTIERCNHYCLQQSLDLVNSHITQQSSLRVSLTVTSLRRESWVWSDLPVLINWWY